MVGRALPCATMSAAARFFDSLTRDGATACGIRLALLFALPSASLSAGAGGLVFWLLAVAGITLACTKQRNRAALLAPRVLALILAASLLPLALNIGSVLWFGLAARDIAWLPLLALAFIIIALARVPDAIRYWVGGAALAGLSLMAITTYSVVWLHHDRPSMTMNALLYGKMALVSLVVCGWGLTVCERGRQRLLLLLAMLASLFALMLTGYRAGWMVLPIVVAAALPIMLRGAGKARVSTRQVGLALAAAVAVTAVAASNVDLLERVQKVSTELESYQQGEINNSSIGSRLSMWTAATIMYRERPLFGAGTHRFQDESRRLQQQGSYPRDAKLYRHAHNTYLNVAAEYGTIGIIVMFAALLALYRLCAALPAPSRALALLTLAAWMVMALTNDVFAHQNLLRILVLSMAVPIAAGVMQRRRAASSA